MPKVQKQLRYSAKELAEKLGLKGEVTGVYLQQNQDRNGNSTSVESIDITAWIEE